MTAGSTKPEPLRREWSYASRSSRSSLPRRSRMQRAAPVSPAGRGAGSVTADRDAGGAWSAAEEVFAAVTEEVGRLLSVEYAHLGRYESDGTTMTIVAGWAGQATPSLLVLAAVESWGKNVSTLVFETAVPPGSTALLMPPALGVAARETGSAQALGRRSSSRGASGGDVDPPTPGPAAAGDTEARLASFTELVATAIANAESRAELKASRARIVAPPTRAEADRARSARRHPAAARCAPVADTLGAGGDATAARRARARLIGVARGWRARLTSCGRYRADSPAILSRGAWGRR